MNQPLQIDLAAIKDISERKAAENDRFRTFLKLQDGAIVDGMVRELNDSISPKIDCTACGNCCKMLMIVVEETEADKLCSHLGQTREEFDDKYLEKGSNGMMLINEMPCHFLSANKCTVYENRFSGCKEFPAMHLPHFKERLFTTFMHYESCPIIFNVVEGLKQETGF